MTEQKPLQPHDLKPYYVYQTMPLLKLLATIALISLTTVAIYELFIK